MIASNQTFIIAAYAVTWLVFAGYVVRLARAERRARASLGLSVGATPGGVR
jgi:CcmD family protein